MKNSYVYLSLSSLTLGPPHHGGSGGIVSPTQKIKTNPSGEASTGERGRPSTRDLAASEAEISEKGTSLIARRKEDRATTGRTGEDCQRVEKVNLQPQGQKKGQRRKNYFQRKAEDRQSLNDEPYVITTTVKPEAVHRTARACACTHTTEPALPEDDTVSM